MRSPANVLPMRSDFAVARAVRDLRQTASAYRVIALTSPNLRHLAMRSCVWRRPYLLERNLGRWPEGLYHLLDRSYEPWLGHRIALTRDDARGIGWDDWYRSSAVQVACTEAQCLLLVDDVLQHASRPKPEHLNELAAMLDRIARLLDPQGYPQGAADRPSDEPPGVARPDVPGTRAGIRRGA